MSPGLDRDYRIWWLNFDQNKFTVTTFCSWIVTTWEATDRGSPLVEPTGSIYARCQMKSSHFIAHESNDFIHKTSHYSIQGTFLCVSLQTDPGATTLLPAIDFRAHREHYPYWHTIKHAPQVKWAGCRYLFALCPHVALVSHSDTRKTQPCLHWKVKSGLPTWRRTLHSMELKCN